MHTFCITCAKVNEVPPCHECSAFEEQKSKLKCAYCGNSTTIINNKAYCVLCDANFVPEDLCRSMLKIQKELTKK